MHFFIKPRLYFAGLLFLIQITTHADTILGACAVHLDKSDLTNLNSPLGHPIRALAAPWPHLDLRIEWHSPNGRKERLKTEIEADGQVRLPRLAPQTFRGGRFVIFVEGVNAHGRLHNHATLFIAESGHLKIEEELDGHKDLSQFFLMVYAALAVVEPVQTLELDVVVKRNNTLDVYRPVIAGAAEMEEQFGPSVHRLNVQARAIFDLVVRLKVEGHDDWSILNTLQQPLLGNLPIGFGPWQLNRLRIAVDARGRVPVFENDDSVTIKYLFKKL